MLIEIQTFRPGAGVDKQDFLAADRRVQTEVMPFTPGFIRRTTARGSDRTWAVITLWYDEVGAGPEPSFTQLVVDLQTATMSQLNNWP